MKLSTGSGSGTNKNMEISSLNFGALLNLMALLLPYTVLGYCGGGESSH